MDEGARALVGRPPRLVLDNDLHRRVCLVASCVWRCWMHAPASWSESLPASGRACHANESSLLHLLSTAMPDGLTHVSVPGRNDSGCGPDPWRGIDTMACHNGTDRRASDLLAVPVAARKAASRHRLRRRPHHPPPAVIIIGSTCDGIHLFVAYFKILFALPLHYSRAAAPKSHSLISPKQVSIRGERCPSHTSPRARRCAARKLLFAAAARPAIA